MIEEQLEVEHNMINRGRIRYYAETADLEASDRGDKTSYARALIPEFIEPMIEAIDDWKESRVTGIRAKYKPLILAVSTDVLAVHTLAVVFKAVTSLDSLHLVASRIGALVEDEIKYSLFRKRMPGYVDVLQKSWRATNTVDFQHKRTSLNVLMQQHEIPWDRWTNTERIEVGLILLSAVESCTDLIEITHVIEKNKKVPYVYPTDELLEWIRAHTEFMSLLMPSITPCIIEPAEWSTPTDGGFYSFEARSKSPLIRARKKEHMEVLTNTDMPEVYQACNHTQRTAWNINNKVLEVAQEVWDKNLQTGMPPTEPFVPSPCPVDAECPEGLTDEELDELKKWKEEAHLLYTEENKRRGKCLQVSSLLRIANEFKHRDSLYFTPKLDFRGRLYPTSSVLSPQGSDLSKALLEFNTEAKINTEEAERWFLVHGANTYGEDSGGFDDRIKFVEDNRHLFYEVGKDPLGTRELWGEADDPWRFLAWCMEYTELIEKGSLFRTSIPIAVDGSCNGLQHFSALFRDNIGGAATNLVPQDKPSDIYNEVAKRVIEKLERSDELLAKQWLRFGVSRDLTKKPVMTMPYGSTKRACIFSVVSEVLEKDSNYFDIGTHEASTWITDYIWEAIGEVVVSAREAMDWLRDVSNAMTKAGMPLTWTTPTGFPVIQATTKVRTRRIVTGMSGIVRMTIGEYTDEFCKSKQANGFSPNFIHSMDASHMTRIVNSCEDNGIQDMACVHDSFGTTADKIEDLNKIIRRTFVDMYETNDPIEELYTTYSAICELPTPPEYGSLDIRSVLESQYFFN